MSVGTKDTTEIVETLLTRFFIQKGPTEGPSWVRFDFHTMNGRKLSTFSPEVAGDAIDAIGYRAEIELANGLITSVRRIDPLA